MLQELRKAPAWWVTWLICKLELCVMQFLALCFTSCCESWFILFIIRCTIQPWTPNGWMRKVSIIKFGYCIFSINSLTQTHLFPRKLLFSEHLSEVSMHEQLQRGWEKLLCILKCYPTPLFCLYLPTVDILLAISTNSTKRRCVGRLLR